MASDWAPGDKALCIRTSARGLTKVGRVYTVVGFGLHRIDGRLGLVLKEVPLNPHGVPWKHNPVRFRKLRPADPEFIALLKSKTKEKEHAD